MDRKTYTLQLINNKFLWFFISFFFLVSVRLGRSSSDLSCCSIARKSALFFQKFEKNSDNKKVANDIKISSTREVSWSLARRYLSGPGSSPPLCTAKCGRCSPCIPVHVPVPPGTPVTADYYPEAWRCKCGDRLYMP